jgi:predicted flavoprotein YhiN
MKSLHLTLLATFTLSASAAPTETDLCIYGGTSAGVIAAVQASKMGKKVVLVEAGQHLGGMSVEGLGGTDIDNQPFQKSPAVGGLALEFYRRVSAQYGRSEAFEAMLVAKGKTRRCGDSSRMWLRLFGRRGSRKRASPCCAGIG